jgi:hypothetical protein
LETHKFLFFLFCLVLLVTDLWFDSIAIDVLCIHVETYTGGLHTPTAGSPSTAAAVAAATAGAAGTWKKYIPSRSGMFSELLLFPPTVFCFSLLGFLGFYFILFCDEGPSRCVWHFHWKLPV